MIIMDKSFRFADLYNKIIEDRMVVVYNKHSWKLLCIFVWMDKVHNCQKVDMNILIEEGCCRVYQNSKVTIDRLYDAGLITYEHGERIKINYNRQFILTEDGKIVTNILWGYLNTLLKKIRGITADEIILKWKENFNNGLKVEEGDIDIDTESFLPTDEERIRRRTEEIIRDIESKKETDYSGLEIYDKIYDSINDPKDPEGEK